MGTNGLPNVLLLLFTMLIWGLYFMILMSSPRNKVNQWCFIAGALLSVGVLKEYIYYSGFLAGRQVELLGVVYEADELVNSILTAVLYYISMPCAVICSLYFAKMDRRFPRLFHLLEILLFFPVLCFCVVYSWSQTRVIPLTNPHAYTIVAVYNLIYGVLVTIPIAVTLVREKNGYSFRQRRLVSVIVLLPLWYWLITVFGFHLLGLENLYKVWQGNVVIILCLFIYYMYHLFHEGIWGMRLSREHFDWSEENVKMPEDTRYVIHMLKNEMAKIRLGTQFIRELESWRQGVFCQLRCDVRLQEKGREQVRELAEELAAERDACPAQLAAAPFTWKEYPIPGRNKLLAPDLIAYVRQAVSISVDAWCAQRKAQIRDILKTASQEASGKLEKIVVALYEAENQRIARWQEREERLKSPELLERLGQLAEENDRLEADFIKEL